jgi:hypothetical protein
MNGMKARKGIGVAVAVGAAALLTFAGEDRSQVFLAGAGAIVEVRPSDGPEGTKLYVHAERHERVGETVARAKNVLGFWPRLLVAFDTSEIEAADVLEAQASVLDLVRAAEGSSTRLGIIGFVPSPGANTGAIAIAARLNAWLIGEVCVAPHIGCSDPPPYTDDPRVLRRALRLAIEQALAGRPPAPIEPRVDPNT